MPFLSRISTFSFNKETFWSAGGYMFVKNLLLFINFLSLLAGLILIGGGAFIQANQGDDLIELSSTIAAGSIAVGCIVTIVSFLGCFGAANEKGMLLKTYFGLLLALVVLELGVGIAAYAKRDAVESLLQNAWMKAYNTNTTSSLNSIMEVEKTFQCCGYHKIDEYAVPNDCAVVLGWPRPCYTSVKEALQNSLSTIGGAGVALGVIEFIGLVFSVLLFVKIAQKDRASESLLNEAWRINRNKIQYGYANYQYV
ncbi:Leukocyte surface antigen cd53 [Blyttiomyces sp. JEL0837]|nr:Leukocyte surface antigen cd53 [Blyttiomyces sp. JEL0837]